MLARVEVFEAFCVERYFATPLHEGLHAQIDRIHEYGLQRLSRAPTRLRQWTLGSLVRRPPYTTRQRQRFQGARRPSVVSRWPNCCKAIP
ncbi:MAG: hypothetical protein JWO04_3791 [Gammaproteobacteria bacterium]|nr:hypothetical protein [Gammaproteobacteria bacterium]